MSEFLNGPMIGGANFVYTTGVLIYLNNKISNITPVKKSDDPSATAAIEDLYSRIECLENEKRAMSDRMLRMELILNGMVNGLSARGIDVNINPNLRRIPLQKAPATPLSGTPVAGTSSTQINRSIAPINRFESDDDVLDIINKAKAQN